MCVKIKKSSFKLNEIIAPHELPLFILDEIGEQALVQPILCEEMHTGAVLGPDIGEKN